MKSYFKGILFAWALVIFALIVWKAMDVFYLAFAAVLFATLLTSLGTWTKKLIRLPYVLSLFIAITAITGVFVLIFWLYSPLIVEQFQLLMKQLPEAAINVRNSLIPFIGEKYLSAETLKEEFSLSNQTLFTQVVSIFSTTVGSIVSFVIFLIVGFYLALTPTRYLKGALYALPENRKQRVWSIFTKISQSLRYWLLGKLLSMIAIGVLTFLGLWLLGVSLAFILGLLSGLLTFIPYVGPILAAIPAILIAFAESPLLALYVILLYVGVHILEGYLITPAIEQRTVFIPPALTIMGQLLLLVLTGALGLALATPIIVVVMALIVSLKEQQTRSPAAAGDLS